MASLSKYCWTDQCWWKISQGLLTNVFSTLNSQSPQIEFDWPHPEPFLPQIGAPATKRHQLGACDTVFRYLRESPVVMLLMCTCPYSSCLATLYACSHLLLCTAPLRPYAESFAIAMASSSFSTAYTDTEGPNVSSSRMRASRGMLVTMVGFRLVALRNSGPPARNSAPFP